MALVEEKPVVFEMEDGTRWRRSGSCCRCGQCCFGDPFSGREGEAVVEGACPLLRLNADGLYACSNRKHSYYLNGCAHWPSHPNQIADKPGCSYEFEKVTG